MIHRIISPFAIKNKPSVFLLFMLMILASIATKAQPGDMIDSLITIKKEFKKNEIIEFTVKLDKHSNRKPYHVRGVSTMSCACNDKDFYYEIYSVENEKYPTNRKSFYIHKDKPDAKICYCKVRLAKLYDNKKYFVPGLSTAGKYVLIIRDFGFIMYSNVFIVTD